MKYKTFAPYPHQIEAHARASNANHYAFLFEMGTGKTFTTILMLRDIYTKNKAVTKTLIVSPAVTLSNWKDEILMHSFIPEEKIYIANQVGKKRLTKLNEYLEKDENIIIITNYEAFLNTDFLNRIILWDSKVIVADEMHYIKSEKSKRSKVLVTLADNVRSASGSVFGLTGTPVLNSPEDLFMQWRFLDGGKTFTQNYFAFRAHFMKDENSNWARKPGYFPKWVFRNERMPEIQKAISTSSMSVKKEEVLKDLPPMVVINRKVKMSTDQRRMYDSLKEDFLTWIDNQQGISEAVVANLAIVKALRLMQIASGFVTTDEGNTIPIQDNPKIPVLKELLQQITVNNKVILWCAFKYNYKQLAKVCEELGIKYVLLTGEQDTEQKNENVKEFRKDPNCKVIIANRKAGGIGINLVEASYSIVFSRNFNLADELQSEARNFRGGSQIHEKITKINLILEDSIEVEAIEMLSKKQAIADNVIQLTRLIRSMK